MGRRREPGKNLRRSEIYLLIVQVLVLVQVRTVSATLTLVCKTAGTWYRVRAPIATNETIRLCLFTKVALRYSAPKLVIIKMHSYVQIPVLGGAFFGFQSH